MAFVGNLLWFIIGLGFISCILWFLLGLLLIITIIGIPFGIASIRIAGFVAFPFGRELIDARLVGEERIVGTGFANFIWIIFAGLWLAISHALLGIACCITIIGIPFGLAHFKLAAISFAPLGKRTFSRDLARAAREQNALRQLASKFEQ